MSLLSKKNLFAALDKPDSDLRQIKPGSGSNRRKQKAQQTRKFQIADDDDVLEMEPLFGKKKSVGSFGFLSSPSSSSIFDTPDSFLKPSSTSTSNDSFLTKNSSERSKIVDEALESSKLSSLTPEGPIEPSPRLGKRKLKAAKKHAKSLTKGSKWFNMSKVEITKEKKNDLEALKLRSAMNGVHHFKRNHMTHTPNYFHVGTIVETSADFYSSRLTKKQRKNTLAEEFAAEYGI